MKKKFRIVTELGKNKEVLYVVQSSCLCLFWRYELDFKYLSDAKEYMGLLIEQRDFKSKVITSE